MEAKHWCKVEVVIAKLDKSVFIWTKASVKIASTISPGVIEYIHVWVPSFLPA
jgi:hypothetical protein